ncbi:MAG: peptide deformylase [Patescibacteria group bacterium]
MIITYPNKLLRQKSQPVTADEIESGETKKIIAEMRKELKKSGGVGLAAVQIGVPKQIILVEVDNDIHAFINTKITKRSWKKISIEEGCLSVPGVNGYVKRSAVLKLEALDENGRELELEAQGYTAIIFQHEIDHTNGILFIDKLMKRQPK